jgi:hypothetical protein
MADPQPCQECRRLVARTMRHEAPHDTLELVVSGPDIGHKPDIGREAEYQCVICGFILAQARNETSRLGASGNEAVTAYHQEPLDPPRGGTV